MEPLLQDQVGHPRGLPAHQLGHVRLPPEQLARNKMFQRGFLSLRLGSSHRASWIRVGGLICLHKFVICDKPKPFRLDNMLNEKYGSFCSSLSIEN